MEPDEASEDEEHKDAGCRMYEQEYPSAGDIVMAHIDDCDEIGARLSLPEYNNASAMIMWSDATRKARVRSVRKLLRKNRTEAMTVLRTDAKCGYIDLSRRDLSTADMEAAAQRFQKAKVVHSLLTQAAASSQGKVTLLELYTKLGWPLYKKFGHAFDAFQALAHQLQDVHSVLGDQHRLPVSVIDAIVKDVQRRLKPKPVKVRTELLVTCYGPDGIEAIQAALLAAKALATPPHICMDVRVISAPWYVLTAHCVSAFYKEAAFSILKRAHLEVSKYLQLKAGEAVVQSAPKLVGEQEDADLRAVMDKALREMQEIPDDEPDPADQ